MGQNDGGEGGVGGDNNGCAGIQDRIFFCLAEILFCHRVPICKQEVVIRLFRMRISAYIDLVSARRHIFLRLNRYKAQRLVRCLKTAGTRPHKQRFCGRRRREGHTANAYTSKNSFFGVVIVLPLSVILQITFRYPRINAFHHNLAVRAGCRNRKSSDLVAFRYLFIDCEIFCLPCTQQLILYCQR